MFELSVAWKYLLPKKRQLSVSIISLISIIVIALVIWLILVFFSVTRGLEKTWIEKLVALTAPVRVTPTPEYFKSYYYQIDHVSQNSDFGFRSISEKLHADNADPYDGTFDEELPDNFPRPDLGPDGKVKDLVKLAYNAIGDVKSGITNVNEYEVTNATMRIRLIRRGLLPGSEMTQAFLSQPLYVGSLDENNPVIGKTVVPFNAADLGNAISLLNMQGDEETSDAPEGMQMVGSKIAVERHQLLQQHLGDNVGRSRKEEVITNAVEKLNTRTFTSDEPQPFYAFYRQKDKDKILYKLPYDSISGHGVLAPKSFRDGGVLLGDRGFLSFYAPTASSLQEQRVPVFVAGFYDPGIVPLGGKFLLADADLVHTIRTAQQQEGTAMTNGINVYLTDLKLAPQVKAELESAFKKNGVDRYWKVETFREFDFAKDLLQQLSSEKNIFSLISMVIIIVACSNIISMLIILVNDKKQEIAVLRAMGASSASIAFIFGTCGVCMGLIGSVLGTVLAYFTLRNLNEILHLIGRLQGYDAFNPIYYGAHLPNQMNYETLVTVILITSGISLIAGLVPAIKSSRMHPAAILRSE